jgi:hypothetical protein
MIRVLLALLAVVALATPAAAQTNLGRTDDTGSSVRNMNTNCKGLTVTTPSDPATGFTVTAKVEDAGTGDNFRAALISASDNSTVLAASAVRTDISTVNTYTFSGGDFDTYNPGNGDTFHLVVCSDSASDANAYQNDAGTAFNGVTMTGAPTLVSPTLVLAPQTMGLDAAGARRYVIYMTYTVEGGGGGAMSMGKKRLLLGGGE